MCPLSILFSHSFSCVMYFVSFFLSVCTVKPLTHFVVPVRLGSARGVCIFCHVYTERGFRLRDLPETFTEFQCVLQHSRSVVCEYCYTFLKDERFRRRSWVLTENNVLFLRSRRDVVKYILEPPEPPFAIYVTKRGQKHGWVRMMFRGVNYSRDVLAVGFEDELVIFRRQDFTQLYMLLREVRRVGIAKELLRVPTARLYRKLREKLGSRADEVYRTLQSYSMTQLYELALTLVE